MSAPATDRDPAEARSAPDFQPADSPPARHLAAKVAGNVIAALLGLAIGYLLLCWFRPDMFPMPW
jgi:hypothetical protein